MNRLNATPSALESLLEQNKFIGTDGMDQPAMEITGPTRSDMWELMLEQFVAEAEVIDVTLDHLDPDTPEERYQ